MSTGSIYDTPARSDDPPAGPDFDAALDAARAHVGQSFGIAFVEAIAALDAALAEERNVYVSECGVDLSVDDYDTPLRDHVRELTECALEYLGDGITGLRGRSRELDLARIWDAHKKLRPYCERGAAKAKWEKLAERLKPALVAELGGGE